VTRATALALGILFIALGGGALAQPKAAPTPETPAPAEAAPAKEIISVAEVIGRATESEREVRAIGNLAKPDAAVVAIVENLPTTRESFGSRAAEAHERIGTVANIQSLGDLEGAWLAEQTHLDAWNEALTARVRVLEERLERIEEIERLWRKTRDELEESGAPASVLERIDALLSAVAEPHEKVTARRDAVLAVQAEIAVLLDEAAAVFSHVEEARKKLRSGLLGADSLPLWTAMAQGRVDSEIREREVRGLMRDLEVARDFAVQRVNRIALHVLFVVVGAIALLFLRRRAARWPEDDASVRASAAVLTRPFSCAVLIGYALTPVLYPAAPSFIYGALGVVGLVPIVRLISPLLEPDARPTFYGLVGFFIVDRVRDLITPLVTLERLLFALEMLVAIVVLGRLLRPSRLSKVTERTRLVPFAGTGLRLAVGLLIVAVGANILGSTALGLLLGEGVLVSVYGAVAVYAVYRVLAGVIGVTLRSTAARKLNMVRGHRSLILRRTLQLLRIAAVLGWFFFVSGRFNVRGDLLAAIASALSARLTIGALSLSLGGVITFGVVFVAALYFSRLLRFVLEQDVLPRMRLPRGVPYAVTATIHYTILFLGLLAAITAAGIDLGKFSILAGALGVGVGFGLQNVVNNFVSGLILLFERPIQTGDVVEVGALLGEVRRIGIRSSTLRTLDGAEVIVPNANLISDQVVNWTLSDRQRRIESNVGVKYGTDPERVLELLLQVARDDERILENPAPDALFLGFGDSSLDFQLRAWTAHYGGWMQVRSDLNVAVNRALADAGIEIPFPQRDLHLRSVSGGVGAALREGADASE
jgi:small-conductance mechanosensitive channel